MMVLLLLGTLPIDPVGDPLPRYLTTLGVTQQLSKATEPLQKCVAEGDHTEPFSFSIHGGGHVQDIAWKNGIHAARDCWDRVLNNHRFSVHDDTPVRVETTMYVRGGIVTLSPQPSVHARQMGPLMLFVLPENVSRVSSYLHGVSDPEAER